MTIYRLITWMNSGSNRVSETKVSQLVKDVILAEDFDRKHLEDFSGNGNGVSFPDDWIQTSITINIPTKSREDGPLLYTIPGFHYCPLVDVICAAFVDVQARVFHLMPFQWLWKDPLGGHQEWIYDELYTSDAWLEAQDNLQKLPKEPGCLLEHVVTGLMFFSDATHLANFGTAKAWPLYMYFGNLTNIKDVLSGLSHISKTGMASLLAHCHRELFHSCWDILLDEDFLKAYHHGIILKCADGVVLIATIKDMGSCLCPRCLMPKALFGSLGVVSDMKSHVANLRTYIMSNVAMARDFITLGHTVDGAKVENTLGEGSWVPILVSAIASGAFRLTQTVCCKNRFVHKLGKFGLDPFHMLVIDIMHECELGTWKALFTHLIRLLYAIPQGSQLVAILDSRFREIPTFGNSIIHKFSNNTSEMKRLAVHNFKDILQCAIPVFEGLFPSDHNAIVQSLLYQFAQWHALAKLRMHSESMITFLEETFKKLSHKLRKFRNFTCAAFDAVELPREKAACQKRASQHSENGNISQESSSGAKSKKFNLLTYKFHAMGDYARTIRFFRTTDSFTTQIGELAHRALKAFYLLTNKLDTPAQLAKHECRRRVLRSKAYILVSYFTDSNCQNFILKLRDHILYRLWGLDIIQTMQVYYTTYDLRRKYDTINPRTHSDVMVLSGESAPRHPYWYARVLGIYHVEVWLIGNGSQLLKQHSVLQGYRSSMSHARLPKIAFVEESDLDAFGFLDPGQVIQGAHLLPTFASGCGISSLRQGKSLACPEGQLDNWEALYVGIFVDRDMFMLFTHLGIGHPTALQRIARDCFGPRLAAWADTMDVVNDEDDGNSEKGSDDKCSEGCDNLGDGHDKFNEDGEDEVRDEGCEYRSSPSDEEQDEWDDGDEFNEFSF
ncbi:hypothetical protein BDR05DRAFT_976856 [Suillus weaverae]|nr:hypothetical protein BDR05DRAFT_976856 [Suillus weaverae]